MTPQEELELIDIELAIRRKKEQGPAAPVSAAPQPVQRPGSFTKEGMLEVLQDVPGSAREALAALSTAPAKFGSSLWDIHRAAKGYVSRKTEGKVFPGAEEIPQLTPKVDALRDALAGRALGNETGTAAVEGLTGGLPGALGSSVTNEMINRGVNPVVSVLAGLLAPAGVSTASRAVRAGSIDPRQVLAQGRIEHAVSGTDPAALREAAKTQSLANRENIFLLPSQGSGRAMPGVAQLETQALMSSAKGAGPLRKRVFGQQESADELAKALVGQAGKPTTVEEAATNLQRASVERVRADSLRERQITEPYYQEAATRNAAVDPKDVKQGIKTILDEIKKLRGNQEFEQGAADLASRLKGLIRKKQKSGEELDGKTLLDQLLGTVTSKEPLQSVTAPDLYRTMQSFTQELKRVDARGVPTYSDNTAKQLRLLSEKVVQDLLERVEPAYKTAREATKRIRALDSRGPFDPLVSMTKANSPENIINQTLKAPNALEEISRGRLVWADPKKPGTSSVLGKAVPAGSDKKAVSEALATALEDARQRAFSLGNTGQRNPSASAKFAREVAGTPTQEESLMRAIQAAGGNPARSAELLELNRALGRPSVVQGARVPVTDITPVEGLRMAGGHELARRAAVMRVAQAVVNRLSDGEVIRRLQQPNSAEALAAMPQLRTATPREKLAAVLTITGQGLPTE